MIHRTDPFPHWVIDDFLPTDMAMQAREHFFEGEGAWTRRHHLYSRHKYTRTQGLGEDVESALASLESPGMLHYLEKLTGMGPLYADGERFGGGQHVTYHGGKLGVHADFTHHPRTGMRRALNLLLYLNDCRVGDGGELELWDRDVRRCVQRVPPVFNRAVLFATSPISYHGHPEPLRAYQRLSLEVYYYQDEPGSGHGWLPTTDYRPRPWEYGLRLRRWVSRRVKG